MTNGLWKGSLLVLIISLYWKKRLSREHTKNPNANDWAHPVITASLYIKMETFDRFLFFQNYRQRYTVIPITTVRGPLILIFPIHRFLS